MTSFPGKNQLFKISPAASSLPNNNTYTKVIYEIVRMKLSIYQQNKNLPHFFEKQKTKTYIC